MLGKGNVEFFFTSGKKIILANVLHVPDMNRNLVNGDLFIKPGVKSVYESSKLILSKNGIFIGKWYSCDGMMKLCTIDNNGNKNNFLAYMVDSVSLWHGRLAHMGISTNKRMVKCGMLSCDINNFEKCETCIKAKMTKKPFHSIKRSYELLDLIHYVVN